MRPTLAFVEGEHYRIDENGCWIWCKYATPGGYGYASLNGRCDYVHRHSYRTHRGPIPEGTEIDHRCRVRLCMNPDHLEAVTRGENQRRGARGFGLTGRCRSGQHEATDQNIYVHPGSGHRRCRPCATDRRRAYNQRRRERAAA